MNADEDFFDKAESARDELNQLLKNDAWEKSFLLKKKKDKLTELLLDYENALQSMKTGALSDGESVGIKLPDIKPGESLVYIALYQSNGKDLMRWQVSMHAIESCSFGRPIYESEDQVKQLITSNGAKDSDGYVEVVVPEDGIIRSSPGRNMVDKLDQPIVNIKPGILCPERIRVFTHHNDIRYIYQSGKLLLDTNA